MPNVPYQPKVSIGARSSPEEVSLRDSGWRPYVPVPVELPTWVPVLPRRVDATATCAAPTTDSLPWSPAFQGRVGNLTQMIGFLLKATATLRSLDSARGRSFLYAFVDSQYFAPPRFSFVRFCPHHWIHVTPF